MDWLGSIELVAGVATLALGLFLIRVFKFVPVPGVTAAEPGPMRLAIIPVIILMILVCGISLVLTGAGLI